MVYKSSSSCLRGDAYDSPYSLCRLAERGRYLHAYYEEDGTRVVNDFRRSGNQWFYLDENGHILKELSKGNQRKALYIQ